MVSQPVAQPGVARRQWLPGMRRKQCRSCLTINRCSAPPETVHELLEQLDQRQAGAALAINQQIVPREQWTQHIVQDGDQICFFRLLQGVEMLRIADKTFDSHLFTGTGKFASSQLMVEAIRASGSQLVTLAMKRVDLRQHNDAILEPLIAAGVT